MCCHRSKQNMVWTVLFSLLAALALNACSDSNNVSGPPAPVPLSPDSKLSSLTVNPGSFQPPFSSDVAIYTVDVATSVTSVTVTAQPQTAGATVNINGQTTTSLFVSLGAAGSNTPISVVVTAPSGSQNTYIVTVNRGALGGNNNLQNLTVSPGPLTPTFIATTTSYTVDVATSVTSVTVNATLQDTNASMTVNGQGTNSGQARTIPLNGPGLSTVIPIEVTALNGSQKSFLVTVHRAAPNGNNNLQSLTVSPGLLVPTFNASTTSYTVNVASAVDSVTVTAQPQDAGATVSIDGQLTTNLSVTLGAAGSNTPISIVVTALNTSQKPYLVTVHRAAPASDNNLSALSVSGQTLSPPFNANILDYTVNVASTVTQVTVSATKSDPNNAVMSGSVIAGAGIATGQTTIPLNGAGTPTSISITVTAQNSIPKTYSVTVNRAAIVPSGNNNLSALDVSAGALVPGFDAAILNYDVAVPNTTVDTTITATVEDSTAALTINGSPAISGVPSPSILLAVGPNSIPTVVTAGNGTPKTYTVMITRDP